MFSCFRTIQEPGPFHQKHLAEKINQMAVSGISNVRFYIGFSGSDEFDEIFSVTGMSLSDEILLIAFTEQLYRAYTIQNHITYHK